MNLQRLSAGKQRGMLPQRKVILGKRGRKTSTSQQEISYLTVTGATFFRPLQAAFFCCFLGLSEVADALACEVPAPARLRDFWLWPAVFAESEGSGKAYAMCSASMGSRMRHSSSSSSDQSRIEARAQVLPEAATLVSGIGRLSSSSGSSSLVVGMGRSAPHWAEGSSPSSMRCRGNLYKSDITNPGQRKGKEGPDTEYLGRKNM